MIYNLQYLSTKKLIINSLLQNPSRKFNSPSLYPIIRHVWKQRLLTSPDDAAIRA